MRALRYTGLALLLALAWAAVVAFGATQGWLRDPLAARGDVVAFERAAVRMIRDEHAGNAVLVLLERGRARPALGYSIGAPVNADARFQMASISKWVTAWAVLRLAGEGRIDLDAPIDRYLKRWHLPKGEFSNEGVTVRRVLAHSGGLGDGLGFMGYAPGERVPGLVEELRLTQDRAPNSLGEVRVTHAPGDRFAYSGGGYLMLQLMVEDVTGEAFASYMQHAVLAPLGMHHSTFDADAVPPSKLATVYDEAHRPALHYRFAALAAASLYSTAADMARFALAHGPGQANAPRGRGVISPQDVDALAMPTSYLFGIHALPIWGLGVQISPAGPDGGRVVGHDGGNHPAIHHAVRIDTATGDGIVVMGSGDKAYAARVADAWLFWHTGRSEVAALRFSGAAVLASLAAGWLAIGIATVALARRGRAR